MIPVVEELCDRIGIINNGQLIAIGTVEEIISQANTSSLEQAFIALTGGTFDSVSPWRRIKDA